MRRVWLAGLLFACGSERDPWPEHRPRAREDAGERLIDAPLAIDAGLPVDTTGMVLIPGGPFRKGCPLGARTCSGAREWNVKAFYMDQTEVTVAAYGACVTAGVCAAPRVGEYCDENEFNWGHADRSSHPINCVTFEHALTYCNWLGKRLPAADEWEKAARGTDGRIYPWGDQRPSCSRAVVAGCTKGITAPVGSRPRGASPYGLLDMAGNVSEIALDDNWIRYEMDRREITLPGLRPFGEDRGSARGGGFAFKATSYAFKTWQATLALAAPYVGFRCALLAPNRRPPAP